MSGAYYNENDPFAAAWLRELIAAGLITDGDVDERSIADVQPSDLVGYGRCHFFAGIGGWDYALRLAGWPDDEPVWTGSCPCQPFSAAGKQLEEEDARHLWPHFFRLIGESAPHVVFGEQVSGAAGSRWLAGVHADLESISYRVGAVDLPSASVGAPHIRQRLWWVADADGRQPSDGRLQRSREHGQQPQNSGTRGVANADRGQCEQLSRPREDSRGDERRVSGSERDGAARRLDYAISDGRGEVRNDHRGDDRDEPSATHADSSCGLSLAAGEGLSAPEHEAVFGTRRGEEGRATAKSREPSFWSAFDIVHCADGKARRVEPGSFPLAHGIPARVGRLRGFGNAINPEVAAAFIEAYREQGADMTPTPNRGGV